MQAAQSNAKAAAAWHSLWWQSWLLTPSLSDRQKRSPWMTTSSPRPTCRLWDISIIVELVLRHEWVSAQSCCSPPFQMLCAIGGLQCSWAPPCMQEETIASSGCTATPHTAHAASRTWCCLQPSRDNSILFESAQCNAGQQHLREEVATRNSAVLKHMQKPAALPHDSTHLRYSKADPAHAYRSC